VVSYEPVTGPALGVAGSTPATRMNARVRELVYLAGLEPVSQICIVGSSPSAGTMTSTTIGKRGRRKLYTDEQLCDFLRWAADYHEKPSLSWIEYEEYREFHPTYKNGDGSQHTLPVPQTIAARFATWQNAVKTAGLQTATNERVSEKFSKDIIAKALQDAANHYSRESLTIAQYEAWRELSTAPSPSARWIIIREGTWLDALKNHGIDISDAQQEAMYTDSEMVDHLQNASNTLGSATLSISQYEDYRKLWPGTPGSRTIAARFDGWRNACEAAGLTPIQPGFDHINKKPL
jgi:hypothetical protein